MAVFSKTLLCMMPVLLISIFLKAYQTSSWLLAGIGQFVGLAYAFLLIFGTLSAQEPPPPKLLELYGLMSPHDLDETLEAWKGKAASSDNDVNAGNMDQVHKKPGSVAVMCSFFSMRLSQRPPIAPGME